MVPGLVSSKTVFHRPVIRDGLGMIQHMTVIVHFISNLTPPLIGQEVLVHGSDVGDPALFLI